MGEKSRRVDFFDVKSDVEAILGLTGKSSVRFRPAIHHALHPGQSAEILIGDGGAGWLGMLHPQIERELGFEQPVFMFELDAGALLQRDLPRFAPLSRFPLVRRDLALVVARDLPAADLLEAVAASGGPWFATRCCSMFTREQGWRPARRAWRSVSPCRMRRRR